MTSIYQRVKRRITLDIATTSIGQNILTYFQNCLIDFEGTVHWIKVHEMSTYRFEISIPERSFGWILFFPMIILLQILTHFSPTTTEAIVKYFHKKRKSIQLIRLEGLQKIRKKLKDSKKRKSTNSLSTLIENDESPNIFTRILNILKYTFCFGNRNRIIELIEPESEEIIVFSDHLKRKESIDHNCTLNTTFTADSNSDKSFPWVDLNESGCTKESLNLMDESRTFDVSVNTSNTEGITDTDDLYLSTVDDRMQVSRE